MKLLVMSAFLMFGAVAAQETMPGKLIIEEEGHILILDIQIPKDLIEETDSMSKTDLMIESIQE